MADGDDQRLLAEQIAYYRARAGEYDATYPLDEAADLPARKRLVAELERLAPFGRVLELACGTGQWTAELMRHSAAVTAVDASGEALAICRSRVDPDRVRLVQADLFSWRPPERFDLVFFAAWLSHVPPQRFEPFWALVAQSLAPGGHVFVVDELPAVTSIEHPAAEGPAYVVDRRLTTGQQYRIVKVTYAPDDLRARLAALGWDAVVRTVGWRYFCATIQRS